MKIKSGKYPVKLRVTYKRVTKNYQTVFDLTECDYKKLSASRVSDELQVIRDKLKDIPRKAKNVTEELSPFCFKEFEKEFIINNSLFKAIRITEAQIPATAFDFDFTPYYKKFKIFSEDHSKPGTISIVYLSYIKKLIMEERIGSAFNYKDSYNSLKEFKGNVYFTDITVSYLCQYEQWMKNKGCTTATVGIKLRPLRAIFNEAIEEGIIKRDKCYPFGKRKYKIPTGKNNKKALAQDQIKAIYYHQPNNVDERKAKDLWLFCYLGNGMNPKDVAYLKYKDIKGDYIEFIRAKTERATRENPKPITVYISEDMRAIIERYGNKNKSSNNFIFPILTPNLTALERHLAVGSFIQFINNRMARIKIELQIEKKLTTIVSRHSFSTQMKRSGASTEFIQEALGHSDKKTTENYLDSFENEIKKEYAAKLIAFKTDDIE